jgi:formylglycine-generating enzyme required for sulfatase activity
VGTYWCPIEAGPFWYGPFHPGNGESEPAWQQVTLPYRYHVGRYLVTNAEYARFIEAEGYQERRWWTNTGWSHKERRRWTQPQYWKDERYNAPNQPVVGVSWFEATAYCHWLTEVGHTAGWLPRDAEIRLPTSLEWERAARHTGQRRYPWGDAEPTPAHANYQETGIGRPAPVGCFPVGGAVCGAQDMVGNVQEWMATPAQQPGQVQAEQDVPRDTGVLLSYSDFRTQESAQVCGSRDGYSPVARIALLGFRLVWSLRSLV